MKAKAYFKQLWVSGSLLSFLLLSSCAENKSQKKSLVEDRSIAGITTDTAVFATGCFWCTEAVFQRLNGVLKVISGYSGGTVKNPTYEEVSNGTTGHAEVCKLIYDTSKISYDDLLAVFWQTHDPTSLNKQGNDVGTQYRSAIFYKNAAQKEKAEYYKEQLNKSGAYDQPIVTEIVAYRNFYPAEDYHQNFYNNNNQQMYCRYVIMPKLEKFEKVFKDKLKNNINR
ncbi:peptide-methionine (S)-S-oxide reductase [Filimonas lacunae]|uniref:Peptide methionine sulfoxide reductase MsrA n=1 Tax=Filimonas lacunae TaxID=477680 RepID=A0A173MKX4_9BACT|nr:peptide-methionine (S)-S-oxide reductase MsrA [Filimonas lacunae]BAV08048.1 peptide methionine sulfoxide reductase MsrA [Filimonas lacunae]SIT08565.1 peptide-methionine (S)-S-oxide reductase [Filimonas lacunae]